MKFELKYCDVSTWTIMSNIHIRSGRPYYKFVDISHKISSHFEGPVSNALANKISIIINNKHIADVHDLSTEIARRRLENDVKTLALFNRALVVSKDFMLGKLEEPFSCELDLGKLLPAHVASRGFQPKADTLLAPLDLDLMRAFSILREMGVVKRDYDRPIYEFTKYLSWTINEVNELTEKYFGTAVKGALDTGVQLKFGKYAINSKNMLAEMIFTRHLEKDGRTLCLFQKAVYDTAVIAFDNSEKRLKFALDIALLTPGYLFKKGISNNEIDDIIDDQGYKNVIAFLEVIGALHISDKAGLPLKNLSDLFYPE